MLLEAKANVEQADVEDTTSLMIAAQQGHEAVVTLLLDAKAVVQRADQNGITAISVAEEQGHQGIVAMLFAAAVGQAQSV